MFCVLNPHEIGRMYDEVRGIKELLLNEMPLVNRFPSGILTK